MRIDPGSDSGTTLREGEQPRLNRSEPLEAAFDLRTPAGQLLSQGHRHRIHKMRAPRLYNGADFALLRAQHIAQMLQRGHQVTANSQRRTHMNSGRNDVVAALAHVDVIVRMHGATETARGERCDHFVRVHVRARARAGLENVNGKLRIMLAGLDIGRRGVDGARDLGIQQLEPGVGAGGGLLHQAQCADEGARQGVPADGKIVHGALRLRAPERVRGHLQFAHAVALDPKRSRHECTPQPATEGFSAGDFRSPTGSRPAERPYALSCEPLRMMQILALRGTP